MYPAVYARQTPEKAAIVMASTGEILTYRELDERSNRCAQLLWDAGLRPGDGIALFLENHPRFFEIVWAAQRSGLYYTAISSRLTAPEIEYIVHDCGASVFFASHAKRDVAAALPDRLSGVRRRIMLSGVVPGYESYEDSVAAYPAQPLTIELEGSDLLYSSGTTGRPKGVKPPLTGKPAGTMPALLRLLTHLYGAGADSVYLSPAPLYHAAPLRFNLSVQRLGGTCVVMEHFDALEALRLIERYGVTFSQWVPTMFVRMLKLPKVERSGLDLSSHRVAVHAAAPCPTEVKEQMIAWWGPILHEYYGGTEGNGLTALDSREWLAHRGSVGRPVLGEVHIVGESGDELPAGEPGMVYFGNGPAFEYHNDPEKTRSSRNEKGWSTLGDIGYVDADGYLYLTDRKAHMIISGGVNIYPQETENVLITHPKVADVAVIGVPNEDFGEEVKAVVQPVDMAEAGPQLASELMDHCRQRLADLKCPRSIDFEAELPRHPTGKLYKRLLKDRYWKGHKTRIL
ncbi:MAG TPA: acyl-CoA synthetase [Deltaproteobacteria bacterium]|jgi:acyl-CoA synthetase (AMP-forming)/AMP-acid ligase II|nr:acyl-CoA synthetase [Deltaproteobacteria bacterium]